MKILHTVEFYDPSKGGMQEVVKQLSEKLAALGHDVTVATSWLPERKNHTLNRVKIRDFKIAGNTVHGFKGDTNAYTGYLLSEKFDIITNFAAQQWATDLALPVLKKIKCKKIFVPTGFSGLYDKQYKRYFRNMKQWMKNYDMNIFLSNNYRDIDFAKKNKIKNRLIIPNGASREEFNQKNKYNIRKLFDIKKDTFLILSIGSHTHLKGHKEAIKIFANANLDNSALLIIGNVLDKNNCFSECKTHAQKFNKKQSSRLKNKKIIIADMLDRKKTIDAYKQSDLFFLPSNIECSPIVLFEAMAAKLPFLSTDCGNAKEIITWSHGGMILPSAKIPLYKKLLCPYISVIADINGSAKILEKIRYNKELSSNLAKNGHSAWLKRFTWEKIAKQYEELYLDLLNNHNDPV